MHPKNRSALPKGMDEGWAGWGPTGEAQQHGTYPRVLCRRATCIAAQHTLNSETENLITETKIKLQTTNLGTSHDPNLPRPCAFRKQGLCFRVLRWKTIMRLVAPSQRPHSSPTSSNGMTTYLSLHIKIPWWLVHLIKSFKNQFHNFSTFNELLESFLAKWYQCSCV